MNSDHQHDLQVRMEKMNYNIIFVFAFEAVQSIQI